MPPSFCTFFTNVRLPTRYQGMRGTLRSAWRVPTCFATLIHLSNCQSIAMVFRRWRDDLLRANLRDCFFQQFVFAGIPRAFVDAIAYLTPSFPAILIRPTRQFCCDQFPVPEASLLYCRRQYTLLMFPYISLSDDLVVNTHCSSASRCRI